MLPSGLFVPNLLNIFLFKQSWLNFMLKKTFRCQFFLLTLDLRPGTRDSVLIVGPGSYTLQPVGCKPVGFIYFQQQQKV
jgi:hypothetical protein